MLFNDTLCSLDFLISNRLIRLKDSIETLHVNLVTIVVFNISDIVIELARFNIIVCLAD